MSLINPLSFSVFLSPSRGTDKKPGAQARANAPKSDRPLRRVADLRGRHCAVGGACARTRSPLVYSAPPRARPRLPSVKSKKDGFSFCTDLLS